MKLGGLAEGSGNEYEGKKYIIYDCQILSFCTGNGEKMDHFKPQEIESKNILELTKWYMVRKKSQGQIYGLGYRQMYHSTTGNAGDSVYRRVEENEFNFRYIMGWGCIQLVE